MFHIIISVLLMLASAAYIFIIDTLVLGAYNLHWERLPIEHLCWLISPAIAFMVMGLCVLAGIQGFGDDVEGEWHSAYTGSKFPFL